MTNQNKQCMSVQKQFIFKQPGNFCTFFAMHKTCESSSGFIHLGYVHLTSVPVSLRFAPQLNFLHLDLGGSTLANL